MGVSTTNSMSPVIVQQTPRAATNDEIARAIEQATQAQEQARQQTEQAREQARVAQEQARQAAEQTQREVRIQVEQAKAQIEQALRDVRAEGGGFASTGAQFPPFPGGGPQIPDGAVIISVAFFVMCAVIAVGLPIARAFSRRVDRRSAAPGPADAQTQARLERIENAVDAIAVEVERISEGQRFTTKILGEMRALPQPDPSAAVQDRAAVPISRAREAR